MAEAPRRSTFATAGRGSPRPWRSPRRFRPKRRRHRSGTARARLRRFEEPGLNVFSELSTGQVSLYGLAPIVVGLPMMAIKALSRAEAARLLRRDATGFDRLPRLSAKTASPTRPLVLGGRSQCRRPSGACANERRGCRDLATGSADDRARGGHDGAAARGRHAARVVAGALEGVVEGGGRDAGGAAAGAAADGARLLSAGRARAARPGRR